MPRESRGDTALVQAVVTVQTRDKIVKLAKDEHRSVSAYVNRVLEQHVENQRATRAKGRNR